MRESGMSPAEVVERALAAARSRPRIPAWIDRKNGRREAAARAYRRPHDDLAGDMFRNRVSAYSCRERASLERERLFPRPADFPWASPPRLAKPGDYLTEDVAGMPVLMTRGADGTVKAFANICRHRGARVGRKAAATRGPVTCPYHGWTYDLAGRLLGTTDKVGFAGIDLARHGWCVCRRRSATACLFVRPKPYSRARASRQSTPSTRSRPAGDRPRALRLETYPMFSADRINPGSTGSSPSTPSSRATTSRI